MRQSSSDRGRIGCPKEGRRPFEDTVAAISSVFPPPGVSPRVRLRVCVVRTGAARQTQQ